MEFEKFKTDKYNIKINQTKQSFSTALDEFENAYNLYKDNPDDIDYENTYRTSQTQLENIISKMMSYRSDIKTEIDAIRNSVIKVSGQSNNEKGMIQTMDEMMLSLDDSKRGSKTFANDLAILSRELRNENRSLFAGIVVLGLLIAFFHKL
jgi:hypothetical protein